MEDRRSVYSLLASHSPLLQSWAQWWPSPSSCWTCVAPTGNQSWTSLCSRWSGSSAVSHWPQPAVHIYHIFINFCRTMKILWNIFDLYLIKKKVLYFGCMLLCFPFHVQKYQICRQLFDPFVYLSKSNDVDSVRHKLLVDPLGVLAQELAVHGVALGLHVQCDGEHLPFDATHKVKVHFLVWVWHKVQLYRHPKNFILHLSFNFF